MHPLLIWKIQQTLMMVTGGLDSILVKNNTFKKHIIKMKFFIKLIT